MELSQYELEAIRKLPIAVAENTIAIGDVKEDIDEVKGALKDFRKEAREDVKATRAAMMAFASALAVPIIIAALKLAFF